MKNNYQTPEAFEVGSAQSSIMGEKVDPVLDDWILGIGFRTLENDIDESSE